MSEDQPPLIYNDSIFLYDNVDLQLNTSSEIFLEENNWWALSAIGLAIGTAAGNILVCLAICWERRLQNVTNYFLMSLAITDLMVAILVMPLGILTLVRGYFPLPSIYCLAWICLDVLFCTASIMHLCTISVDRYLSLRYPMKFGRNKSRRRVILKIVFVWLLSIAMSLPLSLMYSKDQGSLIIDGVCQIPDPLYKLIGSIICFYIPLLVMLVTYALTVRLLANQKQNLGTPNWSSNWMGSASTPLERRCTWRRLLKATKAGKLSTLSTPQHGHSAGSTDTELTTLDTHELWIQESEPTPCTMSALGQFGAEMLKLSRGLQEAAAAAAASNMTSIANKNDSTDSLSASRSSLLTNSELSPWPQPKRRRASTFHEGDSRDDSPSPKWRKRRGSSFHELYSTPSNESERTRPTEECSLSLPPPCTCPYFGGASKRAEKCEQIEVKIVSGADRLGVVNFSPRHRNSFGGVGAEKPSPGTKKSALSARSRGGSGDSSPSNIVVTWEARRGHRRGSSFGNTKSALLTTTTTTATTSPGVSQRTPLLRRSATLRHNGNIAATLPERQKNPSSTPCLLQRYNQYGNVGGTRSVRSHHSRNSSVISRNSSRHGRIIRLEQKATKVLGVVFFTFVILWAPFFILNLLPAFCKECEANMDAWVMHFVTWLGYASSMVNPIFYTIFNKVFRQAFKKVLTCKYRKTTTWRPHR
ncbi:5-hydroxytryptamine receptor 2A [Anthonomus grandis grandis]|uniref:5-hydroxytryptamine receptor 2A n=1 Tax=Anthonomus grandis grandis TaxID=2921223 RepID=UPI002166891A|nr:5-hydroxytryptamine receptor 2A [Anthonomus grandis grandis]